MPRRRSRDGQGVILIFGNRLNPRSSGIASIGHALIKRFNETGRDVLLLSYAPGMGCGGPRSVEALWITGQRPFDRQCAVEERQTFRDFRHLACADRFGLIGPGQDTLARVTVMLYHSDSLVPDPGKPQHGGWSYDRIAAHIQARSGRRPVIVRRRPEDIQGGLSRFMRLTGLDPNTLDDHEKARILDGRLDLKPITDNHVSRQRAELKASGWTDAELDRAIDHVHWVVNQWRLWQREQRELDAVASQTDRGVSDLAAFFGPRAGSGLSCVLHGLSFQPDCPPRVEALLESYRRHGLRVYRGADPYPEQFAFRPDDKVVLYVGRSVPTKGVYELAWALKRLHRQSGGQVKGIFVGTFEPEVRRRLAAVDPGRARDYLLFTGHVYDHDVLASLYAFGDVKAFPSHVENFGVAALESYWMGTPCAITEGTSAADVYLGGPGRRGVQIALPVARPYRDGIHRYHGVDVGSLTRQLDALLSDGPLARRLSDDGRAYAQEHLNGRRMGDDYLRLFDRLQRAL